MLYLFKGERTHIRTTFNQNKNKSDRMFKFFWSLVLPKYECPLLDHCPEHELAKTLRKCSNIKLEPILTKSMPSNKHQENASKLQIHPLT